MFVSVDKSTLAFNISSTSKLDMKEHLQKFFERYNDYKNMHKIIALMFWTFGTKILFLNFYCISDQV